MSAKLADYLTKQIFIEKNVVTFRSLSRQFSIHVNTAKRELATFYENTRATDERSYATYLISGETLLKTESTPNVTQDSMDVDGEMPEIEEEDEDEVVPQLKMTLAGEQDLEAARSSYSRIFSEHVYSLSPSPVLDVGLLCGPSDAVYTADAKFSADESAVLGRISGPHVRLGKAVKPLAASTRAREPAKKAETAASDSKQTLPKKEEAADKAEEKPIVSKPKVTGKLDFSKAKPKAKPDETSTRVKVEAVEQSIVKVEKKQDKLSGKASASTVNSFFSPRNTNKKEKEKESASVEKKEVKAEKSLVIEPAAKRGVKRKSTIPADSESDQEPPPSSVAPSSPEDRPNYKLKGNAILSDDEDEPQPKSKTKGKAKPSFDLDLDDVPSRPERSLKAMMDIDDDQVERVARIQKSIPEPSDSGDEQLDEDVMMADDSDVPDIKPKRKRKEKKVIPVGRNGLKKKRVVKSRTATDAKGYMVTEDHSEYESVGEEETLEEPLKPKKPAKAKSAAASDGPSKAKEKPDQKTVEEEPRKVLKLGVKRTGSKVSQKGSLMNFFGKK